MLDPRRVAEVARAIAGKLARLDPEHAEQYGANLNRFLRRLDRMRARWESQLSGLRGANVVAYHKSFAYLADWLGFEVVAHIEPRPGIPPNPRHVARVLATARSQGVGIILQESFYPESTSELVAERAGATLVRLPGGPDVRRGESWLDFMGSVVRMLDEAAR